MTDSNRRFLVFFSGSVSEFRAFLTDLADLELLDQVDLTACIGRHPAGKGLRQADAPLTAPPTAAESAEWAHGQFCPWCNGRRSVEECTAVVEAEEGAL